MEFPEVRTFLLASYRDLPNILFVGSLILGSLLGYLPLVWMALGLLFNGAITWGGQLLVQFLIKVVPYLNRNADLFHLTGDAQKCSVGFRVQPDLGERRSLTNSTLVTPSYWMSATTFFAVFSIWNSIQVAAKEPRGAVDKQLVANRKAFSISTIVIGVFFLSILGLRAFTGCETRVGGTLGVVFGFGIAIAFWHLLDSCGTGKIPDILQVVGSMAPDHYKAETPVLCKAEPVA